jgi:hypothetical protein
MRFEATCNTCGRRFLLAQILPSPGQPGGRCPFCGTRFGRHYVSVLPEAITRAEASAEELLDALKRLAGMHPGFRIDMENLLARLAEGMGQVPESESA